AINLGVMLPVGFANLDSNANFNSRITALFLSIILGLFINQNTHDEKPDLRLLKYGTGMILYAVSFILLHSFVRGWVLFLIPSTILYILSLIVRRPWK